MRIRASKTSRILPFSRCVAFAVALCAASCAKARAPRPHSPVPAVLVVADQHIALRQNEFVELHASLATAARGEHEEGASQTAYERVLERDEDDALLGATSRALAECIDLRCALEALDKHGLAAEFARALPTFTTNEWDDRAAIGWRAVERAHAAFGTRSEGVLLTLAKDLAITWARLPPPVDVVSVAPPVGRTALVAPLLGARGPCFSRRSGESDDVQNARVVDCVVLRALLAGDSPHRASLGERFWTVLVVHAVAATVTALEPRHISVDRRAVGITEPAMLEVITRSWHGGPLSDLPAWKERARTSALPDNASR